MKKQFKSYSILILNIITLIGLHSLSSCDKKDPTPQQINTKLLKSKTWQVQSVTIDDVDKTSDFTGLTLQFQKSTYTTINGGVVWPSSGTWVFDDKTGLLIT